MKKIGFIQGRLIEPEIKNRVQSFPWKNWKKEMSLAKKNGFKIMEWTIDYKNFFKNPLIDKEQHYIVKKNLKKNGLKIPSVTCDFFMQKAFYHSQSPRAKLDIRDKMELLIENSSIFNIKYLVVPLIDNSKIFNSKQLHLCINFFKSLRNNLKKNKVKIVFETDFNPKKQLKFINQLDSNFGINYDTGNSKSLNFNLKEEAKYFNRVLNIHIKDRKIKGKTTKLGTGDVDFNLFFKLIEKKRYKGNFILQTARSKKNKHVAEINDNIKYLQKILYENR